jgi:hypothetical protein
MFFVVTKLISRDVPLFQLLNYCQKVNHSAGSTLHTFIHNFPCIFRNIHDIE